MLGDLVGDNEDETKELYIIEPQSGDIYVLPKPDEPLQRLPFTMSQLVDMSPFDLPGDDERRVFVGKKETSLLVLELETGRLKGTINANTECPWDPFGDYAAFGGGDSNESREDKYVDLDELDGTKPPRVKPVSTEVLIGRTGTFSNFSILRVDLTRTVQLDLQTTTYPSTRVPKTHQTHDQPYRI